jgi:uncharacterized HAD superfamily protein
MLIGVDLDEVLGDCITPLLEYHNKKYGTAVDRNNIRHYNLNKTFGGTMEETLKKVEDFYDTDYFENMPPVKGAIDGIHELKKNNELTVITSRPSFIEDKTIKWLNNHFPNCFSSVNFTNQWMQYSIDSMTTKGKLSKDLGVKIIIEDALEHAEECVSHGIKVLLMDAPWNQTDTLLTDITRVRSWNEIVQFINLSSKEE